MFVCYTFAPKRNRPITERIILKLSTHVVRYGKIRTFYPEGMALWSKTNSKNNFIPFS